MRFVFALGLLALAWFGIQLDHWLMVAVAAVLWVFLFPNLKGAALSALIIPFIAYFGFALAGWQPPAMVMGQMVIFGFKFAIVPLIAAITAVLLWRHRERVARRIVWMRDTIAMRFFS